MSKAVAYFSASGVTEDKARQLAGIVGADLYEIAPAVRYTEADLDWTDNKSRSTAEMNDESSRPALARAKTDFSAYDTVYIGFPIWWGVAPRIINSFLESGDFSGRKLMIFATSGGSGIEKAVEDLRQKYPSLEIIGGRLLNGRVRGDII